ncbi:transcription termination factor MTERF2, chloroplastic [Canna indica]|uniref:Transcription termination factor MTERF2, chloroplastic n=1 Tax=Canna indica TaxID=4628 RepID=A0AAQ3QCP7_9LILI|nr:transcription termination factor MTERF2, chloroplastic [Canna indica]
MQCHCHHHHLTVLLPSNPNPTPNPLLPLQRVVHYRKRPLRSSSSLRALHSNCHQPFDSAADSDLPRHSRRQNALLLLLPTDEGAPSYLREQQGDDEDELTRKKIAEEYSLATRRVPRFPGSIDFPPAGILDPVSPDLRRVLLSDDDLTLKRTLEVRRGVAAETLKDALRAGKLSINYSTNLVSRLPEFMDRVVIGAAALKGVPEFAHMSFNARAKSYIQSSGIVALVKWLKHNHMTYPQIGKIICMCPGDLQLVRRIAEWLKSVYVKGESLGIVLIKAGPILERSLDTLEEIVNYLQKNGVRKEWMGFVISRCPQVLGLTMEELESRVKFYLDMGMNEKDFGTMVYDYPRALGFFSLEEMASKVQYLKEFGLSTEDVGRLLAFKPQLMGCSIEERWKPLLKYLYYFGIQRDGMKRILLVKPMIFCVDMETTIAPKVRFLQDIGVKNEAIGGVLVKFPSFLTYSLYKKIRPVVIFLMTKAGVSQKDIAKVIALDPQLVGCSISKKLEVNVKYFLSLGIHLQSLGEMIADFPMLLRYNIEILRPKYRYLRRVMVRPLQDLIEFPRFFSYSLDDRMIPRHELMVENRVNFKLRYMLAGSDEDFNQRVQDAIERRRRFESGHGNLDAYDGEASVIVSDSSSL